MIRKLTVESQAYEEDYFREIVSSLLSENGVLYGMNVTERDVNSKIFCAISPGAFVKDGIVYIVEEVIFGENQNLKNQLETTDFNEDLIWLADAATTAALTGIPRLYIVECNLSYLDPSKEAIFKITEQPQPGETVIAFRYIPLMIRDENDPSAGNFTIADLDDNLGFYEEIA